MPRLALLTFGFILACNVVPVLLPPTVVIAGLAGFASYLAWRLRPR